MRPIGTHFFYVPLRIEEAEDGNAADGDDDGEIVFPAEFFFKENAAPDDRQRAVTGDDRGGGAAVRFVADGEDVGKLTCGFADGAEQLWPLTADLQPIALDNQYIDRGDDAHRKKSQLIGNVGDALVERFEDDGVHDRARRVDQAVQDGEQQGEKALLILDVGICLPQVAGDVVLAHLGKTEADDADGHERNADPDRQIRRFAQEDEAEQRGKRARGIADRGRDRQLDIAETDIANRHRKDVAEGCGQIGDDRIKRDRNTADEDLIAGVQTHDKADRHDHLPMAELVIGTGADFAEQVRAAPAEQGDERENKPHTKI